MILARFTAQPQVRAGECRAQFRNQLLGGIGVITEALSELAVAAVRFGGPVGMLMRQCRVVGNVFLEHLERRHLNVIIRWPIVGLVATVPEIGANAPKEDLRLLDALQYRHVGFRFWSVAVYLGIIE